MWLIPASVISGYGFGSTTHFKWLDYISIVNGVYSRELVVEKVKNQTR